MRSNPMHFLILQIGLVSSSTVQHYNDGCIKYRVFKTLTRLLNQITVVGLVMYKKSQNEFDAVLVRALNLLEDDSYTGTQHQSRTMSVSDLFYTYSSSLHLLCSSQHYHVIPNGEEMRGYLIHGFKI